MSNTLKKVITYGTTTSKFIHIVYRVISDGSQETATVLYDNSVDGPNDVTKGSVYKLSCTGKSAAGMIRLEWDQTTKSPIASLNPQNNPVLDFTDVGGIHNPNGTGATGDIVLTTLALASGDELTINLLIKQV